jgi:OmpA-OmpF porin, OOP family
MSKRTLYLLGILATIIIGTFLYNKYCCSESCCKEEEKNVPVLTDTTGISDYNNFNLSGDDFNYNCHDNFRFLLNGFNNIQPVNDSINTGIDQLKAYFDKNLNQKLVITGYALTTEKNTSAYPNLGVARANDVKNYFVSKGIAANRFETLGELRDAWKIEKDTVLGPVNFQIKQSEQVADNKGEDWEALKTKINANPLVLYFNTNQTEINLTEEERQKIADLSKYLDNVADAKISCVGHTDNIGKREINVKLGQGRADFAKDYLSKNGIAGAKIESSSKGPDEPISDNTSPEGKAKNRRTVINLK